MFVAQYCKDGFLVQVYVENGKRVDTMIPLHQKGEYVDPLSLYFKKWGVINENKKRNDANSKTIFEEKE